MALLERHVAFVEALRAAGLPVSLAEDVDAATALSRVAWTDRETLRAVYAATLVKRQPHRASFDQIFDLYFPRLLGSGAAGAAAADDDADSDADAAPGVKDNATALEDLRDRLAAALADAADAPGDEGVESALRELATEAMGRFGSMPGRGPGLAGWSAYSALRRVDPEGLMARVLQALGADDLDDEARAAASGDVERGMAAYRSLVESDARRRLAEEKGPEHVARNTLRPSIDVLDFTSARQADLVELRRQIQPLARRLATRLTKEQHATRGRALDFRRTVRASMSTGGVPLTTHHKSKRPHRSELVVLCDVSGSVANFASFTLLLVFALREQFTKVRAFTFVDTVHEVTSEFVPGADVGDAMVRLTESIRHAAMFGRTNYGRAFTVFNREYADALGPKSSLLVLGDARSNYSDLAVDELASMVDRSRHAWWLNPEHRRNWNSGDSAAREYGRVVPMVECRNLTQLGEFVHDLV
ncbi:MAG TPA: VWA domain-containing protein [Nocardioides sp.]